MGSFETSDVLGLYFCLLECLYVLLGLIMLYKCTINSPVMVIGTKDVTCSRFLDVLHRYISEKDSLSGI